MDPERWRLIEELYHAALERDPSERASYLAEASAGDEALRAEVESLLLANDEASGFLDSPALDVAAHELRPLNLVGRTLGRYEILAPLGSGGMGDVYLARDARLGRQLALKLLPEVYTENQDALRRFTQEARAVSALNHPNIVTVYEVEDSDDGHFIAMELIEGQTLRDLLESGPLELARAVEIAAQVGAALAEAHGAGIVHRDVKPGNIMIRRDGYVKVLDFGLAKLMGPFPFAGPESLGLTHPGRILGTPRYMAPEQLSEKEVDGRADVFSLGVVLYEMVAGRPPFEGASASEVVAAILREEPPRLTLRRPEIPLDLERVVAKAIEKDAERRYQSARDFVVELESLLLDLKVEAKRARKEQSPPTVEVESVGGALPLGSKYYVHRGADADLLAAVRRRDSTVLIKGARQVGKTSLLARGLQVARESGSRVVLTDLQKVGAEEMASPDAFYRALGEMLADQLDVDVFPGDSWRPERGPSINFDRYLRREVLPRVGVSLVWALDEVDRLFACTFGNELFGLFRAWHNERALDPVGPFERVTLALAYATEAHLFITDMNQSPFNIGTRIALGDFTREQVEELHSRYGSPLKEQELGRFYALVAGHPYLVQRGLYEVVTHGLTLAALEATAADDEGPFGDHLRRILLSLSHDVALSQVVRRVLDGKSCDAESFYRLRSAGLVAGDSPEEARVRCELYGAYLKQHLSPSRASLSS